MKIDVACGQRDGHGPSTNRTNRPDPSNQTDPGGYPSRSPHTIGAREGSMWSAENKGVSGYRAWSGHVGAESCLVRRL